MRKRERPRVGWWQPGFLLGPVFVYYVAVMILPAGLFLLVSLYHRSDNGFYDPIFTLKNYLRALGDTLYLNSLWMSFRISVVTTLSCLLLGYPAAYFIAKCRPGRRKLLLIALLFPLLLSTVIRAYGWIALLGRHGLVNEVLVGLGLIQSPIALLYTEGTVLLGLVSILLPYMIINITNTLVTIEPVLAEAATIHGAGPWQTFLHVTLPLSRAGMLSGSVIVFTIAMSTYIISFLLGGPRVKLMGNLIFDLTSSFNWPMGAALSVVLVVATMLSCQALMSLMGDRSNGAGR